ncbi:MAG: hypothetical protein AAF648_13095 [Pseudomonadota bacterium]
MHVRTQTRLNESQLMEHFEALATTDGLDFVATRSPPKFWLRRFPGTLPAAAEVAIHADSETEGETANTESVTELVLRLMWGPLPAPFPRAVALTGLLAAAALLLFSDRGAADWVLAAIFTVIPGVCLFYQRAGEQELQAMVRSALESTPFEPKAH